MSGHKFCDCCRGTGGWEICFSNDRKLWLCLACHLREKPCCRQPKEAR